MNGYYLQGIRLPPAAAASVGQAVREGRRTAEIRRIKRTKLPRKWLKLGEPPAGVEPATY